MFWSWAKSLSVLIKEALRNLRKWECFQTLSAIKKSPLLCCRRKQLRWHLVLIGTLAITSAKNQKVNLLKSNRLCKSLKKKESPPSSLCSDCTHETFSATSLCKCRFRCWLSLHIPYAPSPWVTTCAGMTKASTPRPQSTSFSMTRVSIQTWQPLLNSRSSLGSSSMSPCSSWMCSWSRIWDSSAERIWTTLSRTRQRSRDNSVACSSLLPLLTLLLEC